MFDILVVVLRCLSDFNETKDRGSHDVVYSLYIVGTHR